MAVPLLSLQDIGLSFGGKPLLETISLSLSLGQKFCLIGRNGCGKSTLLKIMAGQLDIDKGHIYYQPGIKIGYLAQEVEVSGQDSTLQQWVMQSLTPDQQDETYRADIVLENLGLSSARSLDGLSGGERRRAALAQVFVQEPDILLLDEPTNHLDLPTIEWLEKYLRAFRGAVCVISHDRRFLTNISNAMGWVDRGYIKILDKGFVAFEEWSEQILHEEQQRLHHLNKQLVTETRWLHQGVTARRKRNQGRVRRLQELRERRQGHIGPTRTMKGLAFAAEDSSQMVIEATAIGKCYPSVQGEERWVIKDFSTRIMQGDRIGIIGANGSGKTTLLKMLTKILTPDKGQVVHGKKLDIVHFDQHREGLEAQKTLWETLCPAGGDQVYVQGNACHVVGYLRRFLFSEVQAKSPVGLLSGGERNRLMLAKILASPGSVMVLDEPTNDLDMDTLDLLQDMLADYSGTVLLISHDRDFLDQLVNSVIVVHPDGTTVEYAGGYQESLQQSAKSLPVSVVKTKAELGQPVTGARKTRLSYHQTRLLDVLPQEIEALTQRLRQEEYRLNDPDFWSKDPTGFTKSTANLALFQRQRGEKEDQLLELMILKEDLE